MTQKGVVQSDFYITAVDLSARLHDVLREAKNISLEAMNAKALVARGGESVRTFRPITDYMVELADETISLVSMINRNASYVSKTSLSSLRADDALQRFEGASQKAAGALYVDSLSQAHQSAQQDMETFYKDLVRKVDLLNDLLKDIESHMLAANVVTSTSRLEAASVDGQYRANFDSIVRKFDKAAKNIRTTVMECRRLLIQRQRRKALR